MIVHEESYELASLALTVPFFYPARVLVGDPKILLLDEAVRTKLVPHH